jgi:hypothetical protein
MTQLALILVAAALAQEPAPTGTIAFRFERAGNVIPNFTLTLHADGSATYQVSYPPEVPKYSPYAATIASLPNTDVTVNVTLTPALTARVFDQVRGTNGFRAGCASKAKNIADTGTKTLTYTSASSAATCVYNYADDKTIVSLTSTFQAIAFTLDEGRKLAIKHRYDRLALDPETEFLATAAKQGNALEFGTIAPTLRAIADDPQVLERVRARATSLLAQAAATP